jgi:predicted transposase YbfD/YdcC
MAKYEEALNIVSAQVAELGITFAQQSVFEKSNEIPAVREMLETLNINGCVVVADALHCQKETAQAVIDGKADYVLNVKDNQKTLKADIEDYVQDSELQKRMDTFETTEKNHGRLEKRRAFTTKDIGWLYDREAWKGLSCIGAVHRKVSSKKGTTDEWHYYISSRELTAEELLRRARLEWSVETMHWLLDVHFREDFCRVEDKNVQENMNMVRKIALNTIKFFKEKTESKRPMSRIMLDCLLDPLKISDLLSHLQN